MHFVVQHQTLYRYSVPVVLAPHLLRLTPRSTGTRLVSRSLVVSPQPRWQVDEIDEFGNSITRVTFGDAPSDHLGINSRFELDTWMAPPIPTPFALPPLRLLLQLPALRRRQLQTALREPPVALDAHSEILNVAGGPAVQVVRQPLVHQEPKVTGVQAEEGDAEPPVAADGGRWSPVDSPPDF